MTDDITKNMSDSDKLDFLINAVSDTNRRLTVLEERMTAQEQRQATLEGLVRDRLQDTRPIWEAVQQQLATQQQQLAEALSRLDTLTADVSTIKQTMAHVEDQLEVMTQDVMKVRSRQRGLEQRLDDLEGRSAA